MHARTWVAPTPVEREFARETNELEKERQVRPSRYNADFRQFRDHNLRREEGLVRRNDQLRHEIAYEGMRGGLGDGLGYGGVGHGAYSHGLGHHGFDDRVGYGGMHERGLGVGGFPGHGIDSHLNHGMGGYPGQHIGGIGYGRQRVGSMGGLGRPMMGQAENVMLEQDIYQQQARLQHLDLALAERRLANETQEREFELAREMQRGHGLPFDPILTAGIPHR